MYEYKRELVAIFDLFIPSLLTHRSVNLLIYYNLDIFACKAHTHNFPQQNISKKGGVGNLFFYLLLHSNNRLQPIHKWLNLNPLATWFIVSSGLYVFWRQ